MINHLNDEEAQLVRSGVLDRRTPETLVEDRWSISPLNRDQSVLAHAPRRVILRDITLRTAEQHPNVWLTDRQRHYLMEELVAAGVSSFQVSWMVFADGAQLKRQVAELKSLKPDAETIVLASSADGAEVAADAGVDIYQTYAPSIWQFNMIYGVYGRRILRAHARGEDWRRTVPYPRSEDEQLDRLARDVARAKELGMRTGMHTSMSHYASVDYIRKFATVARDAGVDEIGLADGASGLGPEAYAQLVRTVKEILPDTPVGLHPHNGFGLGNACACAAVLAGAQIVEVAVNHLCSATGQADLAEVAAALEVLYGIDTGVNLARLTRLARLVEDLTGLRLAANKPITGRNAWTYTEEATLEEESFAPVHRSVNPEVFGGVPGYALGRLSGVSGVEAVRRLLCGRAGFDPQTFERHSAALLDRLKLAMESRGRSLQGEELAEEAEEILRRLVAGKGSGSA